MNSYELLPPVDVEAPPGALGWSPGYGFVFDYAELVEPRGEGDALILDVTDAAPDAPAGVVTDVEGPAPLAALIRADRQLDELRQLHARLAERVSAAGDVLVGVDTSLGADRADVLARLRALADRVARLEAGVT